MTHIYILRLECNKYYVGKCDDIYNKHINTTLQSDWIRKYKPISLEKTISKPFKSSKCDRIVDTITKEYMSIYEIDNVRGGTYVEIQLSDFHKDVLKMETFYNPQYTEHYVKDYTHIDRNVVSEKIIKCNEWECEYCDKTFTTKFGSIIHEISCKDTG